MKNINAPVFIKVDKGGVFVKDDDNSDKYFQWYVTEIDTLTYKIERCTCNGSTPFYTLFHEYRERQNGEWRTLHSRLFQSSKLEKIIDWFNENI